MTRLDTPILPSTNTARDLIFISKGTPNDDEFVLWLAPRLEAEGYRVFADILSLQAGDRWRKEITATLQNRAFKMVLCCTDETLAKDGVIEEIEIAQDLQKELKDTRFIIPLKLKKHKKLFGIGGLQYLDFEKSWAAGLVKLLITLQRQGVPQTSEARISPQWEQYKSRLSLGVEPKPEVLTSNWLRIAEVPDVVRYYEPAGAIDLGAMQRACKDYEYPNVAHNRGFLAFATPDEINEAFAHLGRFVARAEKPIREFAEGGFEDPEIRSREASNMVTSMVRQGWELFCRSRGLKQFAYSNQLGFHADEAQIAIGKKIPWGRQGQARSSMLRNVAKGKVWNYGASAIVNLWPYPHIRLKARVLFSEFENGKAGPIISDDDQQFRLRRTVCKSWRNKQWLGRLLAYLEMLSGDSAFIVLPVSPTLRIRVEAAPILFTSPVSTRLPDVMRDEDEESDVSTFGNRDIDEGPND